MRIILESPDGKFRAEGSLDAGHPLGGKLRQAAFLLPRELTAGTLHLRAEIETRAGVRRPVRWACAQPLAANGAYPITLKAAGDGDWRKNV